MATFILLEAQQRSAVYEESLRLNTIADENRVRETSSVVLLQSFRRKYDASTQYKRTLHAIIDIERTFRGHLGRKVFHERVQKRRYFEETAWGHYLACRIEAVFRGFYSRKHVHDFYARKEYIRQVLQRSDQLRQRFIEARQEFAKQEEKRQAEEARAKFKELSQKMHHLVSTSTTPGVYNSPYSEVPTVEGVPVEHHLKRNTKEYLRREGLKTSRRLKQRNRRSLQAECAFGALEDKQRHEAKLNKIKRVSSKNFLTGVGRGMEQVIDYRQGISHGTPYIEPWRIQQSKRAEPDDEYVHIRGRFQSSVPHSRTFDEISDEFYAEN